MSRPAALSQQRRWQLKMVAAGRCENCGLVRGGCYRTLCDACAKAKREAKRKRLGLKAWRPGGRGRPIGSITGGGRA